MFPKLLFWRVKFTFIACDFHSRKRAFFIFFVIIKILSFVPQVQTKWCTFCLPSFFGSVKKYFVTKYSLLILVHVFWKVKEIKSRKFCTTKFTVFIPVVISAKFSFRQAANDFLQNYILVCLSQYKTITPIDVIKMGKLK